VSMFSWLFSKPKSARNAAPSVPGRSTAQTPQASGAGHSLATLKQQRQERRDHLYSVVRDVMLRSEVLASHYKFKVLSLDTQGRQFLIMMDLVADKNLRPDQLTAIEHLIGGTAAQRHELLVKAVYWRQTEQPVPAAPAQPVAHASPPAAGPTPAPTPIVQDQEAPTPRGRGGAKKPGFEPIGQDEVLAFKKAIAGQPVPAAPAKAASGETRVSGLRNTAAMSGFEDTQLLEPDDTASPLSSTQFGDL